MSEKEKHIESLKHSHIKSYVLRQARMSAAQARAYDQCGQDWIIPWQAKTLDYRHIFSNDNPVILEIGFGMGHATAEIAAANPQINYVAAEVHKPGVGALIERILDQKLLNIRIVHHDVVPVLREMVPRASLSGVHVFFPDPWQKKRHFKRRLIQQPFLRLLADACKAGAFLYMATDWEDYAHWMVDQIAQSSDWRNKYNVFAPRIEWRPQTAFERKGLDKDHVIREIYALRSQP